MNLPATCDVYYPPTRWVIPEGRSINKIWINVQKMEDPLMGLFFRKDQTRCQKCNEWNHDASLWACENCGFIYCCDCSKGESINFQKKPGCPKCNSARAVFLYYHKMGLKSTDL